MKKILVTIFTFLTITVFGQNETNWKEILLKPDLLVHFPKEPTIINDELKQTYICDTDSVTLKITVEKNPLDYKGRTIAEVDKEFYDNLTKSILDKNQHLIKESNFDFDGQHVRELIYLDSIDSRPCRITLQILNVIGWGEAMYKFYLIDYRTNNQEITRYSQFFQNWNLYYTLENKMDENKSKSDDVLKKNGFIIEKEKRVKKKK